MFSNLFRVSGLIESLFRRTKARGGARRQRARRVAPTVQLRLENLEDRLVPSSTPMGGHAALTQPVAAADAGTAVLRTDGSLVQFGPTGAVQVLSPAGTILAICAANDSAGNADVFAITANRNLWEHTPNGWMQLSTGSFQQISAARNAAGNAVVFGVLTDHSLWEHNPAVSGGLGVNTGWQMLSPSGTILSVSAVTDKSGDVAFAVQANGNLSEHTSNGWVQLSTGSFLAVSAGLNGADQAVAFGVVSDHSLWEYNPALSGGGGVNTGWQMLSPSGTTLSVSAGGADEVFAIKADHHLWDYRLGSWSLLSTGTFASISGTATSASGQGEVFAVLADTSVWEHDPFLAGSSWEDLLASGAAAVAAPR